MANMLTKIPAKIFDAFKKMGKAQKIRLFRTDRTHHHHSRHCISRSQSEELYCLVQRAQCRWQEVMGLLTDMGVDAQAQGADTILVEETIADGVRMQLAAQGYPGSGLSYEIFQNASGLGVTEMEKQKYYQFQLQDNLRKTISRMSKVENAVVNIDLGEESSMCFPIKSRRPPPRCCLSLPAAENCLQTRSKPSPNSSRTVSRGSNLKMCAS